jgi:hypothetical protein
MKLKNIPNKEAYENYTFRLRESDARMLEKYRDYAVATYENEFTMPELLNSMVTTVLEDDKAFLAWLGKDAKAAKPPRKNAKSKASDDAGASVSDASTTDRPGFGGY